VTKPRSAPLFDVARVRHNWDRAAAPTAEPLPARLSALAAPVDPLPEAQRLLDRVVQLSKTQFAAQQASLAPFLREAQELLTAMQPKPVAADGVASEAPAVDVAALRKRFSATLDDLQDLFEVYAGIGLG
jgi:hypothetical protein